MISYKPEVIADASGQFVGNGLRFATRAEGELWGLDLLLRWSSARETRVVESQDPVNYLYADGMLIRVEEPVS